VEALFPAKIEHEARADECQEIHILYSLPFPKRYCPVEQHSDVQGTAEGELYVDDGETYDYSGGAYIHRKFSLSGKTLSSSNLGTKGKFTSAYLKSMHDIRVERVIIVGVPKKFTGSKVKVTQDDKEWETTVTLSTTPGKARSIVIRDPKVRIGEDWEIHF
jgi:mannosyl-oligosaccharide alpha-1,3-glucosidase